jgi:hypothetical protein
MPPKAKQKKITTFFIQHNPAVDRETSNHKLRTAHHPSPPS